MPPFYYPLCTVLNRHRECRDFIRLRIDGNDADGIVTAKAIFPVGYFQIVGLRKRGIAGGVGLVKFEANDLFKIAAALADAGFALLVCDGAHPPGRGALRRVCAFRCERGVHRVHLILHTFLEISA